MTNNDTMLAPSKQAIDYCAGLLDEYSEMPSELTEISLFITQNGDVDSGVYFSALNKYESLRYNYDAINKMLDKLKQSDNELYNIAIRRYIDKIKLEELALEVGYSKKQIGRKIRQIKELLAKQLKAL